MAKAAKAIHDLINSKSSTPTVAEIERVLAAHISPATQAMTISALVDELGTSFKLQGSMERGKSAAEAVADLKQDEDSLAARRLSRLYQDIKEGVEFRRGILEQAILQSEPQTVNELLSLLLVFHGDLDSHVHNYCDFDGNDEAHQNWKRLERVTRAIVRGLVNICEADSALLGSYFVEEHLLPREQEQKRLLQRLPEITAERDALAKNGRQE